MKYPVDHPVRLNPGERFSSARIIDVGSRFSRNGRVLPPFAKTAFGVPPLAWHARASSPLLLVPLRVSLCSYADLLVFYFVLTLVIVLGSSLHLMRALSSPLSCNSRAGGYVCVGLDCELCARADRA